MKKGIDKGNHTVKVEIIYTQVMRNVKRQKAIQQNTFTINS